MIFSNQRKVRFALCTTLGSFLLSGAVVAQTTRYVSLFGGHVPPFTNWVDAATNIQDAIDVAVPGDTVLVSNGTYSVGGRSVYGSQSNRVAITQPIVVRSVNGPASTVIEGASQTRCAYVGTNALLEGFRLQFGGTRSVGDWERERSGGGAWCETSGVISNCWFVQNTASAEGGGVYGGTVWTSYFYLNHAGDSGGGASESRLVDCALNQNTATYDGGGAYRCEVIGGGMSNNTAQSGGGAAYCDLVSNCVLQANTANGGSGGGASSSTLVDCRVSGNQALSGDGGGATSCDLVNCEVVGNLAQNGGGVARGTVHRSRLMGNRAYSDGGGALSAEWVMECEIISNRASYGGGVAVCNGVTNCVLRGNTADSGGGGVLGGGPTANSFLVGNTADEGGGAYGADLRNCTVVGNSARYFAGGAYDSGATNCIIYYNRAAERMSANWLWGAIAYTCTEPLPEGSGNFTNAPQLTDWMHLAAGSPCVGAGRPGPVQGVDVDGDPWRDPPAVGCDEPYGTATGALEVAILAPYTNVAIGFPAPFAAVVTGHALSNRWNLAGTTLVNTVEVRHTFSEAGLWPVTLTVFNSDAPAGVTATCHVHVGEQVVHYANPASASPVSPFTSWATAATTLQDAVDAVWQAGALVLATDGVYAVGGRPVDGLPTNRVALTNAVELRSVNGPAHTFIVGAGPWGNAAVRCAYVGSYARLIGFTLTNGFTQNTGDNDGPQSGGGAWCAFGGALSNCVLSGNRARYGGGGAAFGLLENCRAEGNYSYTDGGGFYHSEAASGVLTGNVCRRDGGGAYECWLSNMEISGNAATSSSSYGGGIYGGALDRGVLQGNRAGYGGGGCCAAMVANALVAGNWAAQGGGTYSVEGRQCTIVGNTATNRGGGDWYSTLSNSIAYGNVSPNGSNWYSSTFRYSCTLPLPSGAGNIAADPLFEDAAAGNYRLQSGSPCIDTGTNCSGISFSVDLDNIPRPLDGNNDGIARADMGCYERVHPLADSDGDGLPDTNELVIGTSPIIVDTDGDWMNDGAEVLAGTLPLDASSFLGLTQIVRQAGSTGIVVRWMSVDGKRYTLSRATNLVTGFDYRVQTNILGIAPANAATDTTAVGSGPWSYRVELE